MTLLATKVEEERPRSRFQGLLHHGETHLNGRDNGLNLVRLLLAYMVLLAHSFYITGAGEGPHLNGQNIGGWAVMGFFAISGYLITASRLSKPLGQYLVLRLARIFPAFLGMLASVVLLFAPFAYWRQHGTLDGYLTAPTAPLNFFFANMGLRVIAWDAAGTPAGVPYPGVWNGSMWTLYFEFLCYLLVAVLMTYGFARRSPWAVAGILVATIAAYAASDRLLTYVGGNGDVYYFLQLAPYFLSGALLYQLKGKLPLTWPLAAVAAVIGSLAAVLVPDWGPQLAAPFIGYAIMWVGAVLPCPQVLQRNDISYGVYIYAWPLQQTLVLLGAGALDLVWYDLLAIAATVPVATASWLLIERPVLRRSRRRPEG